MRAASCVVVAATVLVACSGDDGGSVEAFCATARRFAQDNPANVFDQYDPADPTAAADLLRGAAVELRAWADEAPGDIDDDVEVIADTADELATAFEAPAPSAERAAELEQQFADVEEASGRVTGYAREQCAVDLDPAATVATAPSSTAPP
jgi:hypothetical protein